VGFKSEKSNHKFRYVWLYKVRAKPLTELCTKEGTTLTRQTGDVEWTAIKRTKDGTLPAGRTMRRDWLHAAMGETLPAVRVTRLPSRPIRYHHPVRMADAVRQLLSV
jgi:hypothetical protein